MGNKETAEREFAQALVKELQELHTRNYLREIGIVPTQILFAAKHTIEELLRQVAVLETEAALREPAPQPQAADAVTREAAVLVSYMDHGSFNGYKLPAGMAASLRRLREKLAAAPAQPQAQPQPQPQAEPVAWISEQKLRSLAEGWSATVYGPSWRESGSEKLGEHPTPLYAAPPRQQASAEDVAEVTSVMAWHQQQITLLPTKVHAAWARIEADMNRLLGVGRE